MMRFSFIARSSAKRNSNDTEREHQGSSSPTAAISLFVILLLCFVLPACVPMVNFENCRPTSGDTTFMGPDLTAMNTRMEVVGDPTLNVGTLWLKGCLPGEQGCLPEEITVKWDSYMVNWKRDQDATCNFASLPVNQLVDDCERCDYCAGPPFCNSVLYPEDPLMGFWGPSVVRYEGFITADNAVPTTVADLHYNSGCPNPDPQTPANRFEPTGSASYQVLAAKFSTDNESCDKRKVLAEKKVVVITDVAGITIHPLIPHADPNSPLVFYKGTIGTPDWDASFSSELGITKIRIRKGIPTRDPKTNLFMLDETTAKPVRPSRVVLFPGFGDMQSVTDNDTNRCYADASEYGDIDLRRCRIESPVMNPNAAPRCLVANPTRLSTHPDQLTWFVEFNPIELGIVPTLEGNEVLAIEFTIERVSTLCP